MFQLDIWRHFLEYGDPSELQPEFHPSVRKDQCIGVGISVFLDKPIF